MTTRDLRRLDPGFTVRGYDLTVRMDEDLTGFEGIVEVRGVLAAPGDVELHADGLTVLDVTRADLTGEGVAQPFRQADIITIGPFPAGEVAIRLRFRGQAGSSLVGFYRSTYQVGDGVKTIWLTHSSPVYARTIFPCRDEPAERADLTLHLSLPPTTPKPLHAVANGALATPSEPDEAGYTTLSFATVPRLSLNTFFFAFGQFRLIGSREIGDVPVTVHGWNQDARFVLDIAGYALSYCERYFGLPYPHPKLDIVGIPDFGRSGMENAACVTLLDAVLSASPATSTPRELMWAIGTICHEISHMWFGNLVAIDWWNSLWLNEAFATFMEWKMVNDHSPSLPTWEIYGIARGEVMLIDSSPATRPVEIPAHSLEDIQTMFDVITFDKGFAIVLMLEQLVGAEQFRETFAELLSTHAGGTINSRMLWGGLDKRVPGAAATARGWVERPGFPVLDLVANESGKIASQRGHKWDVIVSAHGEHGPCQTTIVSDRPVGFAEEGWLVGNATGFGYYRVAYGSSMIGAVARTDWNALPPAAVFALLEDLWLHTLAGEINPVECRNLLVTMAEANAAHPEPGVWRRVVRLLEALRRLGAVADGNAGVLRAILDARAGSPMEPVETALAMAGDARAVASIRGRVPAALSGGSIDADEAVAALRVGIAYGDAADLAAVAEVVRESRDPQAVRRAAMALACALDPGIFDQAFLVGLLDVRAHDMPFFLRAALDNPAHFARAWYLLTEHWETAITRISETGLARALEGLRMIPDPVLADRIAAFLRPYKAPAVQRSVAAMLAFSKVADRNAERP